MGDRYDWVTTEQFNEKLEEIVAHTSAGALLLIPGVYEVISEHFNNEILEELKHEAQLDEEAAAAE